MWSELEKLTTFTSSSNDADSSTSTCDNTEFFSSTESKEFEWTEVVESTEFVKNLEHMKLVILLPRTATECAKG